MFWLIDSCQNSVSADQYRLTISRARVSTHWFWVFFEVIRWQVATFQMIVGSSSIYLKCICNKSFLWAALLKFWFQSDLGRENSTGFYMLGRQSLLTFLAIVSRWSHSTSKFHALIGQNLTGEVMQKIYAAFGNLLTDSWSSQGFVSSCDVFNCLFLLDVAREIELLTRLFCVIHGWFFLLRFWLRNAPLVKVIGNPISNGIVFKNKLTHLPLLEAYKGLKSLRRFWPGLIAFRSSILTGKPEQLLYWCFFSVSWGHE